MDPPATFLVKVVAGVVLGTAWFALPGYLFARAADLGGKLSILVAPAIGAALWGTASCLVFHLLPYRRWFLLGSFVLFNAIVYLLVRTAGVRLRPERGCWALLSIFFLLGSLSIAEITPVVKGGALFVGDPIYDHAKSAIVDAVAREGLPPVSPYYHPGRKVRLNYYYLWHFMASQLRVLLSLSAWEADAAMSWITYAAAMSSTAAIALRLGAGSFGAIVGALLLTCGSAITGLIAAVSLCCRSGPWMRLAMALLPWRQDLHTLAVDAAWAPQHVLAAVTLVLALVLGVDCLAGSRRGWAVVWTVAALLACTVGCSAWIALAGAVAAPGLAAAVAWSTLRTKPATSLKHGLLLILGSGLLACVLAAPVLFATIGVANSEAPVSFSLQQATASNSPWADFGAWWLHLLPSVYGATLFLGVLGFAVVGRRTFEEHLLATVSLIAVISFLLIPQWLRSTLSANDLGWRAPLPSYLLLAAFAGVGASWLRTTPPRRIGAPHFALARAGKLVVSAAMATLVALGVLAGGYFAAYRIFVARRPPRHLANQLLDERRDLLNQAHAWALVRALTGPDAIVQSNPDGYAHLTIGPVNLPFMLFADRTSAVASASISRQFSLGSSSRERELVTESVRLAFEGGGDQALYDDLRDRLGIDVLLVDRRDPLFHMDVLDESKIWHLAGEDPGFRIYVAARDRP